MDFGIKIDGNNKAHCAVCDAYVGDGKAEMNFCPRCGIHLKLKSAKVYSDRIIKGQIEILYNVLDEIAESQKNPIEVIQAFIKELADEN